MGVLGLVVGERLVPRGTPAGPLEARSAWADALGGLLTVAGTDGSDGAVLVFGPGPRPVRCRVELLAATHERASGVPFAAPAEGAAWADAVASVREGANSGSKGNGPGLGLLVAREVLTEHYAGAGGPGLEQLRATIDGVLTRVLGATGGAG